jgi:NAD(P)-dependent dehydrogenase (short-subunit alcohol dehydrogenase family)
MTASLFDVKGKVALVTGGGKGIGRMISEGYVKAGAKVYIASRDAKELDKTAKELTAIGPGSCFGIAADLQKVEGIEELVKELGKREKRTSCFLRVGCGGD